MREVRSYIVRVYGRKANGQLQGTVEVVSTGERLTLASAEQLWSLLSYRSTRRATRPRSSGKQPS